METIPVHDNREMTFTYRPLPTYIMYVTETFTLLSSSLGHKAKKKNWAENDYYDSDEDTFLDRTGLSKYL